jgi:hypothetical protein
MDADPYEPMFGTPVSRWFRSFAWRPMNTLDRGWVWLRPVWRRRCQKHEYLPGPLSSWFQTVVDR